MNPVVAERIKQQKKSHWLPSENRRARIEPVIPPTPYPAQSEVFFSKIIPKYDKSRKYQTGSLKIEVKQLLQARFIQLTQERAGFRGAPSKTTAVTLDISNPEVRETIMEALEQYDSTFNS